MRNGRKAIMLKYRDQSWDFSTENTKQHVHGLHSYPAMMIPQVAGRILDEWGKKAKWLFDPFCGTGTSLVEANLRGINAIGTDINPLARLIAKVKTTPIPIHKIDKYLNDFNAFAFAVKMGEIKVSPAIPYFKNIDYWFKKETQFWLAVVKAYIEQITDKDVQDFFKVAFSGTVREVSLTRNREFKLYRMPPSKIAQFNPDVLSVMINKLVRNRNGLAAYMAMKQNDAMAKVYDFNTVNGIPKEVLPPRSVDIVLTSPPYGDSKTTVAYGQFSRLSNQWLGLEKMNEVDKRSLGGTKAKGFKRFYCEPLDAVLAEIAKIDIRRAYDVVAFYIDYERSIAHVAEVVKRGGIVAYVVGNRHVKGIEIPNDVITRMFFEKYGFKPIETVIRAIPNKRMPKRNSPSNVAGETDTTMHYEYIVVLQRIMA